MTHKEKIAWMAVWCAKNKLQLVLEGECGFGRPCVGVTAGDTYPDYAWRDNVDNEKLPFEKRWERTDKNGDVWIPPNAYHKHECVAVLGRGKKAEEQLYDWLRWFQRNKFKLEITSNPAYEKAAKERDILILMITASERYRMVRQEK